jgi:peptide deformylase
MIKKTVQVGNPLIRQRAAQVPGPRTKAVAKVVDDLVDSMRHGELVGMAAPQIGKSLRIFVTEIRKTKLRKVDETDELRVYINPRIKSLSKKKVKGWEGCGSVANADLFGMVNRPASLTLVAYDKKGERFEMGATGLLSRIIQHEMDHLNSRVFTDLADTRTYMSQNEYRKLRARKG